MHFLGSTLYIMSRASSNFSKKIPAYAAGSTNASAVYQSSGYINTHPSMTYASTGVYYQDATASMMQQPSYVYDPVSGMYVAGSQPFVPLRGEDEEEDPETKKNKLPIHGNETTCNLNSMLYNNILQSDYFKALYQLRTYHATIGKLIDIF